MPAPEPLCDPKEEEACQLRASGRTQKDAYELAFKVPEDSEANNSSRFFRKDYIAAHVKAIRRWRSVMADLDEGWVLTQLRAIAKNAETIGNANIDHYCVRREDGTRGGIDLSDVPAAKMAALDEVTVDQYVERNGEEIDVIKRTRIKIRSARDALTALELIGKHIGMWPNRLGISAPDGGPMEHIVTWLEPGQKPTEGT